MSTPTDPTKTPVTPQRGRRRWVKVDVDEELFARLHIQAAESRMRFLPFIRRFLVEARAYAVGRDPATESNAEGCRATG